jgi:hypothetical protein
MARPPPTEPVKLMKSKPRADQLFGAGMVRNDILEHALRQTGGFEGLGQPFADQQRLGGMFQDHHVAGHQRGGMMVLIAVMNG